MADHPLRRVICFFVFDVVVGSDVLASLTGFVFIWGESGTVGAMVPTLQFVQ